MNSSGVLDIATFAVRLLAMLLCAIGLWFCWVIKRRGYMKRQSLAPLVVGLALSLVYRCYVFAIYEIGLLPEPDGGTQIVAFMNNATAVFALGAIVFYAWVVASGKADTL